MYCSNCGIENSNNSNFCYNCGNQLEIRNEVKKDVNSGNKETSLILRIICLISSFIVNIICFIPGIISIVYANKYKKESGKLGVGFGLSLGGMIFSFVTLVLFVVLFILIIGNMPNTYDEYNYGSNVTTEFTQGLPNV